ncbi:MAG: viperin family antiviral radical SAM protein [Candidatus Methanoperedens sp.]|nr:viperin family antiviral radical SAM protein [Candidatus Methanoperedens sp.]CAG1003457.1 Putative mycofactocin radical SAM maturase MftC [Methanosarcinales archaeon]
MNKECIKSANWHLTTRCNYACKFCFIKNLDSEIMDLKCAEEILVKLKDIGIEKINFVGGEPLMHPLLFEITKISKDLGFVVSLVSNGYFLNRKSIYKLSSFVDWIGLSVDSSYERVEVALGRGNGNHIKHVLEISDIIHEAGLKLKINTTVTRLNYAEDMRSLLMNLKPERWKILQILHIKGQNDPYFGDLSITDREFDYFISLNQDNAIIGEGKQVFERNNDMIDSYFMLSPGGNVMSNRNGNYSLVPFNGINKQDIMQTMSRSKYVKRGSVYAW